MDRRRHWFVLHACPLLLLVSARIASAEERPGQSARAQSSLQSANAPESSGKSAPESTVPTPTAAELAAPSAHAADISNPSARTAHTSDKSAATVRPSAQRIKLLVSDPAMQQPALHRDPTSTVLSQVAQPAPQTTPSLRLPAFIALGVGGLSAGGAVVTGIVERNRQYDPKYDCARCDGDRTLDQKLALATKILAGVAAVGVSTGLVLLLTAPKEKPSFTPSLGVNVSGSKATAKATWKF